MNQTIELTATREAVLRYFPNQQVTSAVSRASFPIDPKNCASELGQWLATQVSTTHVEDDASHCEVVLPYTEAGLFFKEWGDVLLRQTSPHTQADVEKTLNDLSRAIENLRSVLRCLPKQTLLCQRKVLYSWPVFGDRTTARMTPEAYFDYCAQDILSTGGVIAYAGLDKTPLPEHLARTMAQGAGLALLNKGSPRPVAA